MTPAFQDPFLHSYENESINDFIVTIKTIAEKQRAHTAFQGTLSEYVTGPDLLTTLAAQIETARDEALGHDPVKVAVLESLIAEGVKALRFNAHHVVMVSYHRNDLIVLYEAGYDLKPPPTARMKVNLLDLVPELEAKLGPVEGSILVLIKKRSSVKSSVELQMTYSPDDEQSWRQTGAGTYLKSRIELRGLEPVRRTYIRARYHEDGAVGRWSIPISIIVH